MADKCDPIRTVLRDLEAKLADLRPVSGEQHPPKPPPGLNELVRQIAGTRLSLQACVESLRTRVWTVTGDSFVGSLEIDAVAMHFMKAHSIRAMSIAIAREGALTGNRGYTWAEPEYPITQPNTRFRIASVSKLFTCAAINRLAKTRRLTFETPAFGFLDIPGKAMPPHLPSQTPDPDIDRVTSVQLATELSGLAHDFGTAANNGNDFREIAGRIGQTTVPTRDQLVRFLYGEPLKRRPGVPPEPGDDPYSNSAFTMLTSIVERASGSSFIDFLNFELMGPLGIGDVDVGATAENGRKPNEVSSYDDVGISPSQTDMSPDALAPNAYGGTFVLENGEGAGGLIMSTGTIARFLGGNAVYGVGPRPPVSNGARYGALAGSGAAALNRFDGLDFVFAFNRSVDYADYNLLAAQINGVIDRHSTLVLAPFYTLIASAARFIRSLVSARIAR
jgi:CubicO group peptidase (beta-lactamase class C family)